MSALLLKLDRQSKKPLRKQIMDEICEMIVNGTLQPGFRLPSSRELAKRLGVNRSTVFQAYQDLICLGCIDSQPGSYSTVRQRAKLVDSYRQPDSSDTFPWWETGDVDTELFIRSQIVRSFTQREIDRAVIDFTPIDLDDRHCPTEDLKRSLNEVIKAKGGKVLRYGTAQGDPELREYIADMLRKHSITATADEIMITNGSQQALDLVCRLLVAPGKKVFIEAPTYFNIIPLLRLHRAEVIEIPMLENGMDLDKLETDLEKHPAAFIYTMPNFHNPTGITTTQEHRERLLKLCETYNAPLVEDGFEEEMKYFGKIVLPIKSMDFNNIVIYAGTFSKVLFPGIRLGWIIAHSEAIKRFVTMKKALDLSTNSLNQAILNAFCRNGYYDMHVRRMHRIYRRRMTATLQSCREYIPNSVKWTEPEGGYTIWFTLPKSCDDQVAIRGIFNKHRIRISDGRWFFYSQPEPRHFRISISNTNEEEIKKGIHSFGLALQEIMELY